MKSHKKHIIISAAALASVFGITFGSVKLVRFIKANQNQPGDKRKMGLDGRGEQREDI